jgi:hypothetical protein
VLGGLAPLLHHHISLPTALPTVSSICYPHCEWCAPHVCSLTQVFFCWPSFNRPEASNWHAHTRVEANQSATRENTLPSACIPPHYRTAFRSTRWRQRWEGPAPHAGRSARSRGAHDARRSSTAVHSAKGASKAGWALHGCAPKPFVCWNPCRSEMSPDTEDGRLGVECWCGFWWAWACATLASYDAARARCRASSVRLF